MPRRGRSSHHVLLRSCSTALAPPAKESHDLLSMALASETPPRHVRRLVGTTTCRMELAMRYFFSTGEASGESVALLLADAIRDIDPDAHFEGIGSSAMRAAGFTLWRDHTGWASMGPLAAIPRIPKLLAIMLRTAFHIGRRSPIWSCSSISASSTCAWRSTLRRFALWQAGDRISFRPARGWTTRRRRATSRRSPMPVTAFAHQYDFYRSLGSRDRTTSGIRWRAGIAMRPMRAPAPGDGGTVALLPGSRAGELRRHLPVLAAAYRDVATPPAAAARRLRRGRRRARAQTIARRDRRGAVEQRDACVRRCRGRGRDADGAWVASGTAVLETALLGRAGGRAVRHPAGADPVRQAHDPAPLHHAAESGARARGRSRAACKTRRRRRRLADTIGELMADPARQYGAVRRAARGARSARRARTLRALRGRSSRAGARA